VKSKESSKYFEEHPVFTGSITSNGGKSISFNNTGNGSIGNSSNTSAVKNMNVGMR
jgi:hypothetical protein